MGHTYGTVRIYSDDKTSFKELTLLVDTGSTYTWIRRATLTALKIVPRGKRKFTKIDGTIIEREIGHALIEYDGEVAPTIVVFGLNDDKEVLGVHALEGLGLEVDPTAERLRKVEAILAV